MTREKDVASTWVLAWREGEGQTNPWSILQRADASTPPIPPQSRPYRRFRAAAIAAVMEISLF